MMLLEVHPSGCYPWSNAPKPQCDKWDERLTSLIKQFWLESGDVYGYSKLHSDLRDYGEYCDPNRKPRQKTGTTHSVTPNRLQRQLNPEKQDLS
jgi:putative transposase